jgi:hypothetical protein
MNSSVIYSSRKFTKALKKNEIPQTIRESFVMLEAEIKKLSPVQQIQLFSAASQLLETLQQKGPDSINPLEVFAIQSHAIVGQGNSALKTITLGLAVCAIGLSVIGLGIGLGIGIGMALGLWQSATAFFAFALAFQAVPAAITGASVLSGGIAGAVSGWMFFKEAKVSASINRCVNTVKESYLMEIQEEEELMASNDAGILEEEEDALEPASVASNGSRAV